VTALQGWGYSCALAAFLAYQILELRERQAETLRATRVPSVVRGP